MNNKDWFEDDAFWRDSEPILFHEKRVEAAGEEIEKLLDLVEPAPKAAVLDLCCGVGRHSCELARRDFRVTAVDRTERYLDAARSQAAEEGLQIEFVQADMREFKGEGKFDLAINLFTSFGYFEDPADDHRAALTLYNSLRKGGCVAIDLMGKERLAKIFIPSNWTELSDGSFLLEERKLEQDWGWISNRWILIKEGRQTEMRFGHRPYSAVELKSLLFDVGFSEVQAYGGFDGVPYDQNAQRLLVIGRK